MRYEIDSRILLSAWTIDTYLFLTYMHPSASKNPAIKFVFISLDPPIIISGIISLPFFLPKSIPQILFRKKYTDLDEVFPTKQLFPCLYIFRLIPKSSLKYGKITSFKNLSVLEAKPIGYSGCPLDAILIL